MNESSTLPRNGASNYCGYEFDYQADFTQFLEEAKKNACQGTSNTAHPQNKQQDQKVKKNRKSWTSSLFSWLKKSRSIKQQMNGTAFSKPRRRHVSGPVQGTGSGSTTSRGKRAASGPLTGLFGSRNKVENYEVPYMCLGHGPNLNSPHKLQAYGPVYFVT